MPIAAEGRLEFRDVAYIGVTAGLILAGFEAIRRRSWLGPAEPPRHCEWPARSCSDRSAGCVAG